MKKCAILTINVELMNYGNRLQNFALQSALEKIGCDVETINYHPSYPQIVNKSQRMGLLLWIKRIACGIKRRIISILVRRKQNKKKNKFNYFVKHYIKWSQNEYNINSDLTVLGKSYDCFICGSDQVWNPYWEGTNPIYYMDYVPVNKRATYAVSFGVDKIPDNMKKYMADKISNIDYLACREDIGVHIIKEMTGKDAIQVIDPVFLLTREEWNKLIIEPEMKMPRQKYVLVYFLGQLSKAQKDILEKIRIDKNLNIINLDRFGINSYYAEPREFLYFIKHAELVVTDSFHGIAFSIIFHKKIMYFNRSLDNGDCQDMSSRLVSIFKLFGYIKENNDLKTSYRIFDYFDEMKIDDIIEKEREKGYAYLRDVINCETS